MDNRTKQFVNPKQMNLVKKGGANESETIAAIGTTYEVYRRKMDKQTNLCGG